MCADPVESLNQIDILPEHFLDAYRRHTDPGQVCKGHRRVFRSAHRHVVVGAPEFGDPLLAVIFSTRFGARSSERGAASEKPSVFARQVFGGVDFAYGLEHSSQLEAFAVQGLLLPRHYAPRAGKIRAEGERADASIAGRDQIVEFGKRARAGGAVHYVSAPSIGGGVADA